MLGVLGNAQKQYAAEFRELIAQARASALKAKQQRERQAQEPQQERPTALKTVAAQAGEAGPPVAADVESPAAPTPALADTDVEMSAGPSAAPDERAPRKRSVRLVSPERSPPAAAAVALEALSPAGVGSTERDSPSPPPPALPPQRVGSEEPLSTSDELESGSARTARRGKGARRTRSPSPFDPEGPKPSQRNREEERIFARMAGRDKDGEDEDE